MTIKEFAVKYGVLEITVMSWIEQGYIPGAHDDFVPNSARKPYTQARAKDGMSI